jgi:hypothetical protein
MTPALLFPGGIDVSPFSRGGLTSSTFTGNYFLKKAVCSGSLPRNAEALGLHRFGNTHG